MSNIKKQGGFYKSGKAVGIPKPLALDQKC